MKDSQAVQSLNVNLVHFDSIHDLDLAGILIFAQVLDAISFTLSYSLNEKPGTKV